MAYVLCTVTKREGRRNETKHYFVQLEGNEEAFGKMKATLEKIEDVIQEVSGDEAWITVECENPISEPTALEMQRMAGYQILKGNMRWSYEDDKEDDNSYTYINKIFTDISSDLYYRDLNWVLF